ncbi:unnamed protein product [Peronospora destructor]|uniref:Uncharacterized protein n=1 Tax=Peronospora destructor TaxID=86335 RepID=A0AAV0TP19_9STRA|nr:unnamed protein product [Peronospora destructor]
MDQGLWPWALYDLSGAKAPDSQDTIRDYFRRFRKCYDHLQRSWCAFIRRWNRMVESGESFAGWLTDKEKLRANHSLEVLRERSSENASNENRLCYVHATEGCRSCESSARPTKEQLEAHIAECPLSDHEHSWIRKYERIIAGVCTSGGDSFATPFWSVFSTTVITFNKASFSFTFTNASLSFSFTSGLPERTSPAESTSDGGHHDDMARVLVAQDDVDVAVNRAADAQQEAKEASERAARVEKTAAEIR